MAAPKKQKPRFSAEEKRLRWCMLHNLAQELSYRVRRYNEAHVEELKESIRKRREREMFLAIDRLVEVYTSRLPDKALAYFGGEEAVRERDALLGSGGSVIPLKRNGRPVG